MTITWPLWEQDLSLKLGTVGQDWSLSSHPPCAEKVSIWHLWACPFTAGDLLGWTRPLGIHGSYYRELIGKLRRRAIVQTSQLEGGYKNTFQYRTALWISADLASEPGWLLPPTPWKFYQKNGGCSEFAICNHTGQGERTCNCKPNYIGDGLTCRGNIYQVTKGLFP